MEQIVIQSLSKRYGARFALRDLTLTIGPGMFGLLGRNGAGKTTLMRTLATLLRKQSGQVTVCGVPVERAGEIRRLVGYLPQEFSVYPNMTAEEALDYLGLLSGLGKSERRQRAGRLLERVNLADAARKRVRALSGGMKRRLGLAQALLHNPRVLIVDEPTAGLDPEERIRLRNLLCELARERIVLLSTHIVGDIEATCGEIAVLEAGGLLYRGTVGELRAAAEGRVFEASVNPRELEILRRDFPITGMHTEDGVCQVRFLADAAPWPDARPCAANVEDAYLLCLQRGGVREMGGAQ